ncbi:hypothetical protein [Prosthecobacter sp.]|uniref:hypothetical protein n=1 Tax=Prosthecobacter sp. TaxID=1965333 RepID=UPI001DB33D41|nr:hypothetical protein [Prosthecobacter sp.]MCB1277410.1 hypothetical protein [Prosthecobacter sp.]
MKSSLRLVLAFTFLLHSAALSAETLRTFTDAKGRSLRASLVSIQNNQVTLKLENGQVYTIGLSTLSQTDQQWLKTSRTGGETPSSFPGAQPLPGGMVFSPNWLPQTLTAKRELLESLEFYCKAAIGNAARGKEPVPGNIVGAIRWRMPIDEVIQTLPRGYNKLMERPMVHSCLPTDSLTLCGFQFKSFLDREQPFNQMFLLIDKERKVVSVQFVDQNGKNVRWFPVPDGIREPYYNLISLTHNGSNGKEVPYQILGGGGGVVCIKTAFRDKTMQVPNIPNLPPNMQPPGGMPGMMTGRTYENVHWYLPAPFARTILDIVDVYRKAGVIR